jgi:hypothetical protein
MLPGCQVAQCEAQINQLAEQDLAVQMPPRAALL